MPCIILWLSSIDGSLDAHVTMPFSIHKALLALAEHPVSYFVLIITRIEVVAVLAVAAVVSAYEFKNGLEDTKQEHTSI